MPTIFVLLLPIMLFAQNIDELFSMVEQSPSFRSVKFQNEASFYQKSASLHQQNYRLGLDSAYAKAVDDSGYEYGVSVGRDFVFSQAIDRYLKDEKSFIKLKNDLQKAKLKVKIWRLYTSYCINMKALEAKANLGNLYDDMVHFIQRGVKLGEFSGSDLELAKLKREHLNLQIIELDSYLNALEAKLEALIPFDGNFQCLGLRPDFDAIFYPQNSLLWSYMQAQKRSAKSFLKMQRKKVRQIGADLSYAKEIDTKRYTLSLSIPLNVGRGWEEQKVAALKSLRAIEEEFNALQSSYANETRALKIRLNLYQQMVKKNEMELIERTDELIKMKQAQIKAGESSLFELFNSIETKLSMIESILELKNRRHNAVADYLEKFGVDIEKCIKDRK